MCDAGVRPRGARLDTQRHANRGQWRPGVRSAHERGPTRRGRQRRDLAAAPGRRVAGDARHVAAVDPDRRQGPHGPHAADDPLVERAAVRDGARADDVADPAPAGAGSRSTSTSSTHRLDIAVSDGSVGVDAPRAALGRRLLRRGDGDARRPRPGDRRSGRCRSRSPAPIPFDKDRRPRRPTTATTSSASGGRWSRWSGCSSEFRIRVRRQGQPRAPVLGRARPRRHPVLGPARAAAPGRRAELRPARDARGLLPRGQQRRLLAGHPTARASSTPTPIPSPTATARSRSHRPARFRRRRSASSCCRTSPVRSRARSRRGAARVPPHAPTPRPPTTARWDRQELER